MKYYCGIETGGTKINCIIAQDPDNILVEKKFPTETPLTTLPKVASFLSDFISDNNISLEGIGLAAFGPLDLDPDSESYGQILVTPKVEWCHFPLLKFFESHFDAPVVIDTDVNAAALAEGTWGAATGLSNYIYITIGTGIGGGVVIDHRILHGPFHPEVGHMLIRHDKQKDPYPGICPYHSDCFEGLATGPAIANRWKTDPLRLPDNHPAWDLEAGYIAQGLQNLALSCSPQRFILGGGVMNHEGLIERVRYEFKSSLNGYIQSPLMDHLTGFVVKPSLGNKAGVLGAIALFLQ